MGFRLSKIYTRTGDTGETGLADGRRVAKDHPRVEAMGEVDTLNSHIGLLIAELQALADRHPGFGDVIAVLEPCQHRLFDLGGELAMPDYQALQVAEIERLEQAIDRWNEVLGPLENFILPGGSKLVAQAHICRSLARSAERRCQQLNAEEPVRKVGLAYINRMSDLLFVAARLIARHQNVSEVLWQAAPKQAE
ncbi:cob(I)yrinic acid a,c-diamide adenosyltransferase [Pseudomonas sp. S9]|uniref:cob(I)yrinic acid a,c-diamide adenosyltransferase n=1 Tax=Pseudomonas sp. S9 TaxID=686578 RepID=UPI0002557300|nr:cob(I)yrinic acid a,c-diamide adenosyltransferase [Pseudomonas sp. S9]